MKPPSKVVKGVRLKGGCPESFEALFSALELYAGHLGITVHYDPTDKWGVVVIPITQDILEAVTWPKEILKFGNTSDPIASLDVDQMAAPAIKASTATA